MTGRRLILSIAFWILTGSLMRLHAQDVEDRPPPNVLLILVDDLRPALGCYGDSVAMTAHIDKLAKESVQFERAYTNQAVCAPSRINLMLGSRSTSTGIYGFGTDFRDYYPNAVTLPQYFINQGYHAESMGKVYHIGHGTYNDEASWSVPHHPELVIEYLDSSSTGGQLTREEALFANASWEYARSLPKGAAWESPDVPDTAYADGRIAARAIKRLRALSQDPEQPFFMAVGFARPHLPFTVPQKYWDLYDPEDLPLPESEIPPEGAPEYAVKRGGEIVQYSPIPHSSVADPFPVDLKQKLIHGYYAGVSFVDVQIGKIMEEMKNLGLDQNTIVILWGDHGFHLGELGIWTKHVNYEMANRIPLLVRVPESVLPEFQAGKRTFQMAETVDIYPTLTELAGLDIEEKPQPNNGESLVHALENPAEQGQGHSYHCYPRGGKMGRAIRTERYRLVEWKVIDEDPATAEIELYDYHLSALERKNIAAENPGVVSELRAILDQYPEAVPGR